MIYLLLAVYRVVTPQYNLHGCQIIRQYTDSEPLKTKNDETFTNLIDFASN